MNISVIKGCIREVKSKKSKVKITLRESMHLPGFLLLNDHLDVLILKVKVLH